MRRILISVAAVVMLLAALLVLGPCRGDIWMYLRYWNKQQPVEFYGQVVDGRGQPVAGATVTVDVQVFSPHGTGRNHSLMDKRQLTRTTDAGGRFEVRGVRGTTLSVSRIERDGYVTYPNRYHNMADVIGFRYAQDRGVPYYVPDPQRPAIFPIQKYDDPPPPLPTRGGHDERNPW
jgi:hypothetical protein